MLPKLCTRTMLRECYEILNVVTIVFVTYLFYEEYEGISIPSMKSLILTIFTICLHGRKRTSLHFVHSPLSRVFIYLYENLLPEKINKRIRRICVCIYMVGLQLQIPILILWRSLPIMARWRQFSVDFCIYHSLSKHLSMHTYLLYFHL